jgi:hypothetical protein
MQFLPYSKYTVPPLQRPPVNVVKEVIALYSKKSYKTHKYTLGAKSRVF